MLHQLFYTHNTNFLFHNKAWYTKHYAGSNQGLDLEGTEITIPSQTIIILDE